MADAAFAVQNPAYRSADVFYIMFKKATYYLICSVLYFAVLGCVVSFTAPVCAEVSGNTVKDAPNGAIFRSNIQTLPADYIESQAIGQFHASFQRSAQRLIHKFLGAFHHEAAVTRRPNITSHNAALEAQQHPFTFTLPKQRYVFMFERILC